MQASEVLSIRRLEKLVCVWRVFRVSRLTALGRERLGEETAKWERMAGIIGTVLGAV